MGNPYEENPYEEFTDTTPQPSEGLLQKAINSIGALIPRNSQELGDVGKMALHQLPMGRGGNISPQTMGPFGLGLNIAGQTKIPETPMSTEWGDVMEKQIVDPGMLAAIAVPSVGGLARGVSGLAEHIHSYSGRAIQELRPMIAKWMGEQGALYDVGSAKVLGNAGVDANKIVQTLDPIVGNTNNTNLVHPDVMAQINDMYTRAVDFAGRGQPMPAMDVKAFKDTLQPLADRLGGVHANIAGQAQRGVSALLHNIPGYTELQASWAPFAQNRNFANQNIQPWMANENPANTRTGVGFLQNLNKPGRATEVEGLRSLQEAVGPEAQQVGAGLGTDLAGNMGRLNSLGGIGKMAAKVAPLGTAGAAVGLPIMIAKMFGPTILKILGIKMPGKMPQESGINVEANQGGGQ